jgi:excisionase family DNA binding protein
MIMEEFLTTRQVLNILKVDRITIYRMLQDGRIKGVKIGQQWRFQRQEVDRVLGVGLPQPEISQPEATSSFPTYCVQAIQDLFSEVGQIGALVVDKNGEPITEVSHPCRFCQIIRQSPEGMQACLASWKEFARQSNAGSRYFTCHAGLQYVSAPIQDKETNVGHFLTGEFYWQTPNPQEEAERIQRLASTFSLSLETLQQAAHTVPVITLEKQSQVEVWPTIAARAVSTILRERTMMTERLEQIAKLTQIQ